MWFSHGFSVLFVRSDLYVCLGLADDLRRSLRKPLELLTDQIPDAQLDCLIRKRLAHDFNWFLASVFSVIYSNNCKFFVELT